VDSPDKKSGGAAGRQRVEGKTDVSIIASEPLAAETVDRSKPAIVPAAVFIIVEIMLAAETISVILLKEIDPRNPISAPIAILLSMALLVNLGFVCSMAAAMAASSVRQRKRERARALNRCFAAVGASGEGIESAAGDISGLSDAEGVSCGDVCVPQRES
jgi:hypothetical protein